MFSSLIFTILFSLNSINAQDKKVAEEEPKKEEKETVVDTVKEAPDSRMVKFKDLIITSSYGAFAGAVIGLATLAFVSKPGSKLKNVAVGASVGLYAGTLLGLYLGFAVGLPKPIDQDMEEYDDEFGYNFNNNEAEILSEVKDVKFVTPVFIYNF